MNRQFRRAQEKQDKKQQKEKTRRREERKAKVRQMRQARRERSEKKGQRDARGEKGDSQPAPARSGGRVPGRFSGVLAAVTVFFISLQGAVPESQQQEEQLAGWQEAIEPYVYPGFYLMLGYFATLWFMRRGSERAPLISVIGGTLLAASVVVAQLIREIPLEPLSLALVVPALILGAYLGRLVFVATPR